MHDIWIRGDEAMLAPSWWPWRTWRQELLDKLDAIAAGQRSLKSAIEDLTDTLEGAEEESSSQINELRDSLKGKTAFIEGLFSTMLDKTIGNGHTNGATKEENSTLVDISKLSSSQQEYIRKQLKNVTAQK